MMQMQGAFKTRANYITHFWVKFLYQVSDT